MEKSGNRRQFLKTGAASVTAAVSATAAATTVGFWVAGGSSTALGKSPNEQIQFACIGVGGKGTSDLADAAKHGKIMGLCDIDGRTLAKAAAGHPEAKKYYDFRTMLDELGNTIDAVTVSTPRSQSCRRGFDGDAHGQALLLSKTFDTHHLRSAPDGSSRR